MPYINVITPASFFGACNKKWQPVYRKMSELYGTEPKATRKFSAKGSDNFVKHIKKQYFF